MFSSATTPLVEAQRSRRSVLNIDMLHPLRPTAVIYDVFCGRCPNHILVSRKCHHRARLVETYRTVCRRSTDSTVSTVNSSTGRAHTFRCSTRAEHDMQHMQRVHAAQCIIQHKSEKSTSLKKMVRVWRRGLVFSRRRTTQGTHFLLWAPASCLRSLLVAALLGASTLTGTRWAFPML